MKNSFSLIGKEVIQTEINALKKLKKSINKDFDKIIVSILKCKGKVVLSGVGKSGIISKKIASTLSSLGVPSFYVDAGSCSHGDLGMISAGDVIILISHSGESAELKNIVQYAKRNKAITLIGLSRARSVESAQFFIDGNRGSNRAIRPFEVRRNIEWTWLGSKAKSFLFIKEYSRSGCFRRTYDPYPIS